MMSRKLLLLLGVLFAVGAALSLHLSSLTTNCGGNSAALAHVSSIVTTATIATHMTPDRTFRFTERAAEYNDRLVERARSHWLPAVRFLVTTAPLLQRETRSRRIIVVCDTPFTNVPRQWIGSAPPAYAAGFADGDSELISPEEFAALDLSTFVALDELYPPKPR